MPLVVKIRIADTEAYRAFMGDCWQHAIEIAMDCLPENLFTFESRFNPDHPKPRQLKRQD